MASVRKKYNHAAKVQQERARLLKMADFKIRKALNGVTVAYNSSWGESAEFYPTGMGRIIDLLKGDIETACGTLVQIDIRWRVYITIYCVTQDGEDYVCLLPVINQKRPFCEIFFYILNEFLPKYRKKENSLHFVEWSFYGEIV